jgi:hypothetical protein
MSQNPPKPPDKPGVTREQLIALGHKVIEPPAKFTEASLRAAGFKVPPAKGEGFTIVPVGKSARKD